MKKILVVDDEESIRKVVDYALSDAGFEVHTATDGGGARMLFSELRPDLVILDVMLPGESGLDVAKHLRAESNIPIIMLSARGDEIDRILGLEFGADDYVTKPFSPRELVARVRAILRRASEPAPEPQDLQVGELLIDTRSRQVKLAGESVHLTTSEYEILSLLARNVGAALSRHEIMTALWGAAPVGDERAVDVHIHNMREKIEPDPKSPRYVHTVRGYGYRLEAPPVS